MRHVLGTLLLLANSAIASTTDVKLLIDTDRNLTTGCRVITVAGNFDGVEQIFTTTYDNTSMTVTGVTRQQCLDPTTATFGAPTTIDAGGWRVGSVGGNQVVETHVPAVQVGGVHSMRFGLVVNSGTLTDALLQQPGGGAILFLPDIARPGRPHVVSPPGGRAITLDGDSGDWAGIVTIANGASSGSPSLRFLNISATDTVADFFFLIVIQANPNAPTANDDLYLVLRGATLTVSPPGILGNDTDPKGKALTAVLIAGPAHGLLALNGNGGFSYTNDGSPAPVDGFMYKVTNGTDESNAARVTINILSGTPPATTSGNSATFTVGTAGSFTVTATGNPTPSISQSGALPAGVSFNTSTHVLSGTPAVGSGGQYLIVFTAANVVGTTSQNFTLNVNEGAAIKIAAANQTVCAGATATFTAAASGFPTPTVQWQISTNGGVTFTNIAGATAGTYAFVAASSDNGNQYRAVFTNPLGTVNTTATLTVNTAPVVTTQPANQTVCAPANATFTAAASGTPVPTVQWQVSSDGGVTFTNVVGATSTTYTFATVAGDNGKQYRAAFTNSCSTVNSNSATLTVNTAAAVTTNPASQTVCNNTTATFTAAASGSPAPTVQWQVSIDNGLTFNNLPGATATTLSFMATTADNAKQYRAVFTNVCNTATSTAATLTVNTPPAVTTQPANQTVCAPANATFTAAASGTPVPTVQWQVSSDGGVTFTNVVGATSTTYTFATAAADNGKQYRASFTNSCSTVNSNSATLTVNTATAVTTNPASQTVCNNTTATFTAAASGSPAPTVQWQVSLDNGVTFNNLPGATATTLSFMATTADNAKQYRAVFTNVCNTATSTAATLTVTTVPVVTTNPANQTICAGAPVTFTAATSSPATTVQWQLSTDGGATFNNILGATSTSYNFITAPTDNNHQYRAVFTNVCGTTNTTAATLTVNVAPAVTTQPVNQTVCDTNTATFTAAASGSPAPTVQWQVSSGGPFANIPGATTTTLSFAAVAADNGKQYRAVFTNSCAVVNSNAATLTVNTPPVVTTNPATQTICAGNMASFTVAATGQPVPTIQWQLSIDGGATFNPIGGATLATYSFITAPSDSGHQYRAVLTNSCGTATSTAATLTVNVAPAVTTQPMSQTVCAGLPVTFTSAASGTPAPTIQWQVSTNGGVSFSDIIGQTASSYTHDSIPADNGKQYRAVFTNACGIANSNAATLTVNTPPVVTTDPASQAVCNGTMASFTVTASGSPAPTVQWQLSIDGGATFNNIGGATTTTYAFTVTPADNLHQFRAVFTNLCNTATTAAATLTVDQTIAITTQPTDQSVTANNPVTFTSAATNFTSVQWMVSTDGGTIFNPVPGATSPSLTYSPPLSDNGKKFKATYTNSCGSVDTNVVTLTVTCPAITVARNGGGSFPAGTFNTAYVGQSMTASGGLGPYTFTVTAGALPTNLSLSSGGAISGTPSATGTFGFTVTATDANLCTGSQAFTIAINPSAATDVYGNLVNNTEAVVTGGATGSPSTPFVALTGTIIANDLPGGGVAVVAGTVSSANGTNNVVIAADGTFKYTPPLLMLATDSFSYTISSNTGGTLTPTQATGTVTLNLSGRVWYVNNSGANGNGQSQSPFNSTSNFTNGARVSPDASGDIIFIHTGDGTTTNQNGGVALLANEQLIGQGVALVVNGNTLVAAGVKPQIGNSAGDGVTLKSANTVKGLTITGSSGSGIYGTGALGVNTLDVLTVQNSTLAGIRLDNASGTVTWNSGTINNNAAAGVDIINGGSVNFTYGGDITQTAGAMVNVAGGHNGTLIFNTGTLNATGGTGLQFDNADGAYTFNGTTTLNGGDAGIDILNGSSGSFSFSAGASITNPTGDAFHVNGSAPALINYFGSISSNAAQAVSITNGVAAACGTQNFTGSITATGAGILINNCNAGTITFSGSTNNFNTFANPAVEVTNIGAAVKFTGGNLTINATSGHGFFVNNGGGTVEVTGNNNTVVTTTGLAVQISQVSVGAGGVTFKSVNAGGTNGIILSNTGTTGTFTVTGTGTAGSGGTINTSGNAVQIAGLTSLSFMNITGGTGIIGGGTMAVDTVSVTGTGSALSLNTATVTGNFSSVGGTTSGVGVTLNSVSGNFTVLGGTLTTSAAVNVLNVNAGNATINWQGTLTQSQNAALMLINGTNTGTITFSGGTLSATNGTGLQFSTANGTYNFNGTTTLNGGDAGVDILVNSTGTFSFGGGVTITNPSGSGFTVNGSTPAVTYSGNISKSSAGLLVDITNQAASARVITFQTGTLTGSGTSTGINLNNVDGTVNFNGATTLSGTAAVSVNTGSSGSITFGAGASMTNVSGTSFTVTASNPIVSYAGSITTNTGTLVSVNALSGNSVTFSGGLTSTAGSTAISVTNNTAGSVTFSGGINSFTTGAADAIVLTTNTGSTISFNGGNLSVNTTTGRGVNASAGGTLTFTGGTNNISSGNTALLLNGIALGAGNLNNVTSSAGTNGISLTSVTGGTLTIAGGSLTGNTGSAFLVTGGTRTISYGGGITQNSGSQKAVDIQNSTGGTITFGGAVNSTAGGISLLTNTGTTMTFTGGVTLSTGANNAFTATGGGTLNVTGSANTISTSTGTALNVANTTIGASGLTFQSISSNGGSSNGIILDTTGSSGGLTVTGISAAGSGGTIANKTGADGSTTQGSGIFLNSTSGVSLNHMQLNGFQNFGIRGTNVTGFTLDNSIINGTNGTNSSGGSEEGAIRFDGLFTSVSFPNAAITNSTVGGTGGGDVSFSDDLRITNSSGTLNRLTINNTHFGTIGINGNNGLTFSALNNGTVMNLTLTNSFFTNAIGTLADITFAQNSSMDLVIQGNAFSNNNVNQAAGGGGLVIQGGTGSSTITYDVCTNTFRDAIGIALLVAKGNGTGTITGSIINNTIGVSGVSLSGSTQASGIKVKATGTGTHTVLIKNNTVHQTNEEGIFIQNNDGSATLNATVFGNTVDQPGAFSFAGLNVDLGALGTDTSIINVVVGSAGIAANKNDFSAGDPSNFSDVNLSRIPGAGTQLNLSTNGSVSATAAGVIDDDNLNPANTNTGVSGTVNLVGTLPATPPAVTCP